MKISAPHEVLHWAYSDDIDKWVKRIEDALSGYINVKSDGNTRIFEVPLKDGEYVEDAVQKIITKLYVAQGWTDVSFRYSDRIELHYRDE